MMFCYRGITADLKGASMTRHELKKHIFYFPKTGKFTWRRPPKGKKIGDDACMMHFRNTYKGITINQKLYSAKKLAWLHEYGEYPDYKIVAINGDPLETRIEKLIRRRKGYRPETRKTFEELKELLRYDKGTGLFVWKMKRGKVKKGTIAGSNSKPWRQIKIDGLYYMNSRLSWLFTHGSWPKYPLLHMNRNPMDDRVTNLYPIKKGSAPKPLLKTKIKGLYKNLYTQMYELSGHREFKSKKSAIQALLIDKAMGIHNDGSKAPNQRIRGV